jgi:phosphohistidine phosphatase
MMQVYLVRHAIAHERNRLRWPNDGLRPLTTAGIRKFRKAASGLSRCVPKRTLLLTSPYVRARETAAMLAEALESRKPLECAELTAGEPPHVCFALLRKRREDAIVLVGHEPNLSEFAAVALAGERANIRLEFKKGGAACVEFTGRVEPGRARLKWLLTPRALRALG